MTRIFLLDDHHIVRVGLCSVLQAAGHDVVGDSAVSNGAIEAMIERRAEVLLLDIHLKSESGLCLLQQMQAQRLSIQTVVLSMSAQPRHVADAIKLGALGYVLKGSPSSELLDAIRAVVAGQIFFGAQVDPPGFETGSLLRSKTPLSQLSTRELEILKMVVSGMTSAAIASTLALSPKTVDTYRSRLMTKLEIRDLPSLVRFSIQWGLIDL